MESSLFTIIPNLGIGVVAIITLGYVTREFINHLRLVHQEHKDVMGKLHSEHLTELKEREVAIREVEKEVRQNITEQLSQNTQVMDRVVKALEKN